jgi:hypothetical protein
MISPDITLVTAGDAGYFWGAFLLAASIRRHQLPGRVLVMQAGFDAAQQQLLTQFPDVTLRPADPANPYSFNNRKAEALLLADSEFWRGWRGKVMPRRPCRRPSGLSGRDGFARRRQCGRFTVVCARVSAGRCAPADAAPAAAAVAPRSRYRMGVLWMGVLTPMPRNWSEPAWPPSLAATVRTNVSTMSREYRSSVR